MDDLYKTLPFSFFIFFSGNFFIRRLSPSFPLFSPLRFLRPSSLPALSLFFSFLYFSFVSRSRSIRFSIHLFSTVRFFFLTSPKESLVIVIVRGPRNRQSPSTNPSSTVAGCEDAKRTDSPEKRRDRRGKNGGGQSPRRSNPIFSDIDCALYRSPFPPPSSTLPRYRAADSDTRPSMEIPVFEHRDRIVRKGIGTSSSLLYRASSRAVLLFSLPFALPALLPDSLLLSR